MSGIMETFTQIRDDPYGWVKKWKEDGNCLIKSPNMEQIFFGGIEGNTALENI